ncbi:MAG TPA: hypothetical protein DCS31_11925 [Candidatus Competibacteraceae bacterium]|jgi:hypothetical protein|nr:hypothetical protein [Candidatus Competibacteraceae bacterium]
MNTKKVAIGAKPTAKPQPANPDAWVDARQSVTSTKRLTIDVPANLHARIKASCAMRGTKMVDEITAILQDKFQQLS